jgi:hypothetical protein
MNSLENYLSMAKCWITRRAIALGTATFLPPQFLQIMGVLNFSLSLRSPLLAFAGTLFVAAVDLRRCHPGEFTSQSVR